LKDGKDLGEGGVAGGDDRRGGDDAFSNAEAELDRDGFRRRDGQLVHRERIVAETCAPRIMKIRGTMVAAAGAQLERIERARLEREQLAGPVERRAWRAV